MLLLHHTCWLSVCGRTCLAEHSVYTGCSYFIIDMSAMDLTSFRVTNYVAAAPYVLAVCLKLYISFRPFSIYRVFRFYRRECYGINVLPSDKLSYCCTISCACMFALTDITVFSIINFPSGISRCDDKVFLVTNAECTILRHEITLRHFSCCGMILSYAHMGRRIQGFGGDTSVK